MSDNLKTVITRLLKERLKEFNVPKEVQDALRGDILAACNQPTKKPYGACVMTAEASMAADRQRRNNSNIKDENPKII